jgi:hypothetical protein
MKLKVECCDECPMFSKKGSLGICSHPSGPDPWEGEGACGHCPCNLENNNSHMGVHPECPLFKENMVVSCGLDCSDMTIEDNADFLSRQIIDDLYRAGLDARFYQHVVEETIINWPNSGRIWGKDG